MYLTDPDLAQIPSIRHGFFTRNGGVSEGIYASLNVGRGSSDVAQNVQENRRRVAEAMGADTLNSLYQIHSDTVLTIDQPLPDHNIPQADALVTKTPGLLIGALAADCAPILFADAEAGVVGAAHAGWPGAFANIMERTLEAMEALGAVRSNILAVVGPCIHQPSYEVGAEFYERFLAQSGQNSRFFIQSRQKDDHFQFDLPGYVSGRMRQSGVGKVNILAKDTCFEENTFFSNRRRNLRGEADYGRQVSAIMLRP